MLLFVFNGSVRSCLNTFGPDQYELPRQIEEFKSFFFIQMIFIKIGALLGRFVNPIFREDVQCFGADDCYPLAFGIPAMVFLVGVIILLVAKNTFVRKPPPRENVIGKVTACTFYAIKMKYRSKSEKKSHWLDYAEDKYDEELIKSTKIVFQSLTIFLGIAIYWSCFMQQNSRWIFQAAKMNGDLGFYKLKPDQIIALNPISALIYTPLCNYYIYPLLSKCGIGSLLDRVVIGGFLCCASFLLAIIIEIYIEEHYISMLWLFPQYTLSALSEVFVFVSLLNFAYAEAPANMKSVMTACVYLTIALGDMLIPIVSGSKIFKSQAVEFSFFLILLFINMLVFCFLVRRYNRRRKHSNDENVKK
jgi:solute carrier family 15 oligopeptide transporter 1